MQERNWNPAHAQSAEEMQEQPAVRKRPVGGRRLPAGTQITSGYTDHKYVVARDGSYRRTNKPVSKRSRRRMVAAARQMLKTAHAKAVRSVRSG